jgi:hypothetical protein
MQGSPILEGNNECHWNCDLSNELDGNNEDLSTQKNTHNSESKKRYATSASTETEGKYDIKNNIP